MCLSISNVVVCARVRPGSDLSDESSQCITCGADNDLDLTFDSLNGSKNVLNFQLDHVFGPTATQEIIFNNLVKPMINEALQGYNMTLFTFGQTGSGKTHTMQGSGTGSMRGTGRRTPVCSNIPRLLKPVMYLLGKAVSGHCTRITASAKKATCMLLAT